MRRHPWALVGGLCAVTAPAVMWGEFLVHGLMRPHYNMLTRAASDLAMRGTPHAFEYSLGMFYLAGVLIALVGVALWRAVPRGRGWWRLGAAMVAVAGVLLVLTGVFPEDPHSPWSTGMHGAISQSCFFIASLAPFALLAGAPEGSLPTRHRQLWLAFALAGVVIELFNMFVRSGLHLPDGVFQRPFTMAITAWFVVTGLWLLGHHHRVPHAVGVQDQSWTKSPTATKP